MSEFHHTLIVGAGPGGLSVAAALVEKNIKDVLVLEKGVVGQAWLDYPPETRLLSESSPQKDENMIAHIPVGEVMPNISHPTHVMYQRYLQEVVKRKAIQVREGQYVESVSWNSDTQQFTVTTQDTEYTCQNLVWAAGMYTTPNEKLSSHGCFIHYSRIQEWDHISESEIYVIGGANGATEVVLQLAKPERKVYLLCSHFDAPEPIDCLWKENRQLVKRLENQGLVDIVEGFRVKQITHNDSQILIESEDGKTITTSTRPIICIGFLPNIEPVQELISIKKEDHEELLDIDEYHQSKKQPHLFFAGTIGKVESEEAFIRGYREYATKIAEKISA